jgi:hypothetical protein
MSFDLVEALEILERTPSVLNSLLQGLSDTWLEGDEGEGTFSPMDVIGHLIHGEKTDWVERIKRILGEEEGRTFEPYDHEGFHEEREGKHSGQLLQEFHRIRIQNLRYVFDLKLDEEELDRTGTHPEFGTVTLRQLIATWAVHDISHIAQICRAMAKQYGEDVGPWSKYLNILKR